VRVRGFTLVEVLVALFVFALIAAAAVALLGVSVRAQDASRLKLDEVGDLQRTAAALGGDLAQAVDRPTRDAGGTRLPAFAGERSGAAVPFLRLVRGGWSNLDGAGRPTLQKVEYRLAGDALERVAYPQLDGAPPFPPARLLTGVAGVALRYRSRGGWSDRWDGGGAVPLPDAMEMTVTRRDGTTTTELLPVGTGYDPRPELGNAAG
jgi:general secretion pathway protein J